VGFRCVGVMGTIPGDVEEVPIEPTVVPEQRYRWLWR
jgi:hypothetical protein